MTSDLNSLLRAVITNPDEDTPRLQFADALDELPTQTVECVQCKGTGRVKYCSAFMYGCSELGVPCMCDSFKLCDCMGTPQTDTTNRDRAEFIRVQVEMGRMRSAWPKCQGPVMCNDWGACDACNARAKDGSVWRALESREMRVLNGDMCRFGVRVPGVTQTARRGFVEEIRCTSEVFLKYADEMLWHPKQTVEQEGEPDPACRSCYGTGQHEIGECSCAGTVRVPRECPDTAHPIRKVILTTIPSVLSFDSRLRVFHFEGRDQRQFVDMIDQGPWTEVEVGERLLEAYWPGIKFMYAVEGLEYD